VISATLRHDLSVTDVIVKSSNRHRAAGAADRRRAAAGVSGRSAFEPTGLEIVEAPGGAPLLPPRWSSSRP
jgi:cell division protein FtsI (penicillin-binding protein 3)